MAIDELRPESPEPTDKHLLSADELSDAGMITISITWRKNKYEFHFSEEESVVASLFEEIHYALDIPIANQKIIVPKAPLLKSGPDDNTTPLHPLQGKNLTLIGSPCSEIRDVQDMSARVARRNAARQAQRVANKIAKSKAKRQHGSKADETQYTFMQVRPLANLPHPERSMNLLMRLKNDAGIVKTMRKHKFTVGLLTEMEPLAHTESTHEGTSRILGLNRNGGEVIELRLRTDAHDGYRDYNTIRKTLCHELTHNVHGDHDRAFWDLCHQIEKEVQTADWKSGGRTISGDTSRYKINGRDEGPDANVSDEEHQDDGVWKGGSFVLGGVARSSPVPTGMSRREVLAHAAEERQRKDAETEHKAECGWRPCRRPSRNDGTQ